MVASDFIEFYTIFIGWWLYDANWAILYDTGLWLLPFIGVTVSLYIECTTKDFFKKNSSIIFIKLFCFKMLGMLTVLILAVIPHTNVSLVEMNFAPTSIQCSEIGALPTIANGLHTNTTGDKAFHDLAGKTSKVPVWFGLMHGINKGVTNAAIAGIPCINDFNTFVNNYKMNQKIPLELKKEVGNFHQSCWRHATLKYKKNLKYLTVTASNKDRSWIGSQYFLSQSGFYDSLYAKYPVATTRYSPPRDNKKIKDGYVIADGGYPRCDYWYQQGLRQRLLDNIDEEAELNWYSYIAYELGITDQTEKENYLIRSSLEFTSETDVGSTWFGGDKVSGVWDSYLYYVKLIGSNVGMAVDSAFTATEMHVLRQSLSIIQYLLVMFVVLLLPLYFWFAKFSVSSLLTITVIFFALEFLPYLWAVAYWVEVKLFYLFINGDSSHSISGIGSNAKMILNYIGWAMYVALPVLWMSVMSWAGSMIGSGITEFSATSSSAMSGVKSSSQSVVSQVQNSTTRNTKTKSKAK